MGRLLTTGELAKHCSVTTEAVANWIRAGKLMASVTPGGHYRIEFDEALRFLKEYGMPPIEPERMAEAREQPGSTESRVVLVKTDMPSFVRQLTEVYRVYGPVARGSQFVFHRIENSDQLRLDYLSTIVPPKKFLLPKKETLLTFDLEKGASAEPEEKAEPLLLLGVHSCDMQAILRLDNRFRTGNPESSYFKRREQAYFIGVTCTADEYCFCDIVRTQKRDEGFDLFFSDIGQSYYVTILTKRGQDIMNLADVQNPTQVDELENRRALARCTCETGSRFKPDVASLPLLCQNGEDLPMWDEIAAKCLSCGTCTMVCPTCYCFDVLDEIDLDLVHGRRNRFWDSCQLEEFAEVAGGESFRKERRQRQKHRFYRKFRYLMSEYGSPFCVGCGRCGRQCVAGINVIDIANQLQAGVNAL